jgi:hypothetical protein
VSVRVGQKVQKVSRSLDRMKALRNRIARTQADCILLCSKDESNAGEERNWFERAIEIAKDHSSKSLELHATLSLARLLAAQGKRDEAGTMVADIYNWFTEGFDTADLKDAKAPLDELKV